MILNISLIIIGISLLILQYVMFSVAIGVEKLHWMEIVIYIIPFLPYFAFLFFFIYFKFINNEKIFKK